MTKRFIEQVFARPSQPAIIQDSRCITYSQLDLYARLVASQLSTRNLPVEGPVVVLTCPGIEHIVAQIGILYAGGTVLPMDPDLADGEIRSRLEAAGAKYLISDTRNSGRCSAQYNMVLNGNDTLLKLMEEQLEVVSFPILAKFPIQVAQEHRSHIYFTSGTTGVPKAVQILAQGITRLQNLWTPTGTTASISKRPQMIGHINNVSFDASILDIWVSLIDGCTIAVLARDLLLNPHRFVSALRENSVTALFITSSLFNVLLRHGILWGEVASLSAVKEVLQTRNGPPGRLINAYGPTEFSVFATVHVVTMDDVDKGRLPLGKPLMHTDLYLLNDSLEEIEGEGSGELAIGGAGLARGYLNDIKKTNKSFILIPNKRFPGQRMRVYLTGDLVERQADGELVWRARLNNEVKIRGYRVNLDIVEKNLMRSGLLVSAAAIKLPSPDGSTASLVAAVTMKNPRTKNVQTLLRQATSNLPKYMIPRIVVLDSLPLNRNGKMDRRALELLLHKGDERDDFQDKLAEFRRRDMLREDMEIILKLIWSYIIGIVTPEDIESDSDFFELGATSLNVASMTIHAREAFGILVPASVIYEYTTLKRLAVHMDKLLQGGGAHDIDNLKQQWLSDVMLAQNLALPDGSCPDWTSANEGRCLVRADTEEQGLQRILANLTKYNLLQDPMTNDAHLSKLIPVLGDLSKPRLGLDQDSFESLGLWASVIYHLGAQVNYNQPYTIHRPANVIGTLHILELAATGRPKALHYISSIAAFGPTGLLKESQISEDQPLDPYIDSIVYETGYGQSQWVADMMVQTLIRKGFPIAIHRLGFVLCHSETGIGNQDDFMARLVVDCINMGAYPYLPNQRKELLPVDYACSAILSISLSNSKNLGKVFHITPDNDATTSSSMDMTDLFQEINDLLGIQLAVLSYDEWLVRLSSFGDTQDLMMAPLLPVLTEKVYRGKNSMGGARVYGQFSD
ncbi:hypothetical protein D9757_009219 [Collybiopsis confluens]|uniref:Carrier domain-containing protein n=1 Tax=Collybiopsis confluens TaxID=2823264 RepID=A0A8H5HAC8_9AGAR|nr:hypothetical protein D9757_009219 [Collybiopsis confluens]